jgi:tRNA dimethylallyltransferase
MPEVPPGMREQIIAEYELNGLSWLQHEVMSIDPEYFKQVDQTNPHRLIRALELYRASGKLTSQLRAKEKRDHDFDVVKIGLQHDREKLYEQIDRRMDVMIEQGLFEEAKGFFLKRQLNALQTVGYREVFEYLEGNYDRDEAIRLLKRNTRRYAKRQLTWFKRDVEMKWFSPDQVEEIIELIDS